MRSEDDLEAILLGCSIMREMIEKENAFDDLDVLVTGQ